MNKYKSLKFKYKVPTWHRSIVFNVVFHSMENFKKLLQVIYWEQLPLSRKNNVVNDYKSLYLAFNSHALHLSLINPILSLSHVSSMWLVRGEMCVFQVEVEGLKEREREREREFDTLSLTYKSTLITLLERANLIVIYFYG